MPRQIKADLYYAVHLLGELKSWRAVDLLLPLLEDSDISDKVVWALGEIGDERARVPLIAALDDRDALAPVAPIQALVKLNAAEALPKLRELLSDDALPSAGGRVSVADTARKAIARIQQVSPRKE